MKHEINISTEIGTAEGGILLATGRLQMGITQNDGDWPIAQSIPAGSHAEFITEHYWGYTALREGCSEYRVGLEMNRNATGFEFNADVATL